jgi:DNA-binding Lrp family transcriptional regulator
VELTDPTKIAALVHVVSDEYSRKILFAAIPNPMSVDDLSRANDIPMSTCYRRVHELLDMGLLLIERIVVTPEGKRYEVFRSSYRSFSINFGGAGVSATVEVNEDVAEKLRRIWLAMKQ